MCYSGLIGSYFDDIWPPIDIDDATAFHFSSLMVNSMAEKFPGPLAGGIA